MVANKLYLASALLALGACATPPMERKDTVAPAPAVGIAQPQSADAEQAARRAEYEAQVAKEHAVAVEVARIQAAQRAQELAEAAKAERSQAADMGADLSRLQGQVSGLKAQQTERGWVLTLHSDLLFDSGTAVLKPASQRAIENLAGFMRKYADRDIAIEGFTDAEGSESVNLRLSEARAAAVKRALVSRGVEPSRIDSRGYGPAFPVASNETPTGRQLNRRVEIVINPS